MNSTPQRRYRRGIGDTLNQHRIVAGMGFPARDIVRRAMIDVAAGVDVTIVADGVPPRAVFFLKLE